jgi:hypothetical protein
LVRIISVEKSRRFVTMPDLRTISGGDELTAYFCLCADSVRFLPFPVGHLTKKTRFGVVCSRINSLALPRGTALLLDHNHIGNLAVAAAHEDDRVCGDVELM